MKRRYFSLFLATLILLTQAAGAGQSVYAAEFFAETEQEKPVGADTSTEPEAPLPTSTPIPDTPAPEELTPIPADITTPTPTLTPTPELTPLPTQMPNLQYVLELEAADGIEDMWPGETTTVKPVVYQYETGKEAVEMTGVQYRFSYDEENFKIWKDGAEIKPDDLQDGGIFTIERLKNSFSGITLYAVVTKGEQNINFGSRTIQFQKKDYNIFFSGDTYNYGWGEYFAWVLVDDENPEENRESITFTVDTEKLGGIYEIEWHLPIDSNVVDERVYEISGENGKTITIYPKALADNLKETDWSLVSDDHRECYIGVSVKAEGEKQAGNGICLVYEKANYKVRGEEEVVLSSVSNYKDGKVECYVHNEEYPGRNLMLDIKELNILSEEPEIANTNVFTVEKEGDDILLKAENCGRANLEYHVVLPSGTEKTLTYQREVVKDKFHIDVWSSTGSTNLLPNAELKLESEIWHEYYDAVAQIIKWEKLEPEKYTIVYNSPFEDCVTVEADGTVRAKDCRSDGWVELEYAIHLGEGREYLYYKEVDYVVVDDHFQIFVDEIFASPGETVNITDWEIKKFDLDHRDGIAETGWDSVQLYPAEGITLNEEKTGFTVNDDVLGGKKIKINLGARREDGNIMYGNFANGSVILNVRQDICQHNFVQTAIKDATCTEPGSKTLECSNCHVTQTETIPVAGHNPGSFVVVKQPSCTMEGSREQKCTVCGEIMDKNTIPPTGHSFGEWEETTKATALKEGIQTRACKTCHVTETRNTDRLEATIKLNVKKIPLQVKKSTTEVKVVSMTEGDSVKSWASSNKNVATVTSKGKITGKKAGTARITVTLQSGISATVTVKVQKKAVTTTKLTVTGESVKKNKLTLKKGKSVTLAVVRTPVTSTEKITYTSSAKKIAVVSAKGKITAKKAGKARITVKSGKKKVVIGVTVKK